MAPNGSITAGTTSRLAELRKLMKHKQVDIYGIVPGPTISSANDKSFPLRTRISQSMSVPRISVESSSLVFSLFWGDEV